MIKIGRENQIVIHKSAFIQVLGMSAHTVNRYTRQGGLFENYQDEKGVWVYYNSLSDAYQLRVRTEICQHKEPLAYLADLYQVSFSTVGEQLKNLYAEGFKTYAHLFQGNRQRAAQKYAMANYLTQEYFPKHHLSLSNLKFIRQNIASVYAHLGAKPSNAVKLQRFLKDFAKADMEKRLALCSNGLLCNKNAKKMNYELLKTKVVVLRAHEANFSISHIHTLLGKICADHNMACPSMSWVAKVCKEPKIENMTGITRGLRQLSVPVWTPTAKPQKAGVCWQIDGTRLNFVAHKDQDGKDKFLYIVAVMDLFSGCYVGTYLGHSENRYAVMGALQNACENTGYLPKNIVIDRFPGHNTQDFRTLAEKLTLQYGVHIRISSEATGKAQIERSFRTFQETILQGSALYYGEGITSKRSFAHRSEAYIKKLKKLNLGLETAIDEAIRVIDAYNQTPLCFLSKTNKETRSRQELHDEHVLEQTQKLAPKDKAFLFFRHLQNKVSGGNICFTHQGINRYYQLPEELVMTYNNVRLDVYSDENNPQEVHVYQGEQYLATLPEFLPIDVFAEPERLQKATERKKRILAMTRNELKAMQAKANIDPSQLFDVDYTHLLSPKSTPKALKHKTEEQALGSTELSTEQGLYKDAIWKI